MSSHWNPQSSPRRRRSHENGHTFRSSIIWRSPVAPDRSVASRGRDGERHYFCDLTIGESRRPINNRRSSTNVGYLKYPPLSGYPCYEWDEYYEFPSSTDSRCGDRIQSKRNLHDEEQAYKVPVVIFDSACTKLFQQLEHAEQFYQNFQQEFDNEVSLIKKYAGDGILRHLWSCRIGVPPTRRDSIKSEEEDNEWESQLKKPCQKFRIQATKLDLCLQKATIATITTPKSRKDETSVDSAKLLQAKIKTAGEGIRSLLHKVYCSRQYCSELVKELNQLKTLVNPQTPFEYEEEQTYAFGGEGDESNWRYNW